MGRSSAKQVARYLAEAERCRRLASQMTDLAVAEKLRDIATTFETLARQLIELDDADAAEIDEVC